MSGPALVFEGEESMITAISENPANFKVICAMQVFSACATVAIACHFFLFIWRARLPFSSLCEWNILFQSMHSYDKSFYCSDGFNRER
jgi:hypothetical protein